MKCTCNIRRLAFSPASFTRVLKSHDHGTMSQTRETIKETVSGDFLSNRIHVGSNVLFQKDVISAKNGVLKVCNLFSILDFDGE